MQIVPLYHHMYSLQGTFAAAYEQPTGHTCAAAYGQPTGHTCAAAYVQPTGHTWAAAYVQPTGHICRSICTAYWAHLQQHMYSQLGTFAAAYVQPTSAHLQQHMYSLLGTCAAAYVQPTGHICSSICTANWATTSFPTNNCHHQIKSHQRRHQVAETNCKLQTRKQIKADSR